MVIALEKPRSSNVVEFTESSLWDGLRGYLRRQNSQNSTPPAPIKMSTPTATPIAQTSPMAAAGKISDHYALLKSLAPNDPTRLKIEGKLRHRMADPMAHGLGEAAAFAALWRAMERGSNGNLLHRDITRAATLTKLQPIAASAKIDVPQTAKIQTAIAGKNVWVKTHSAHEKSGRKDDRHRANKSAQQKAKVDNIRVGLETANVAELADRHIKAQKLMDQTGAIADPKLAREAGEMAQLADRDVAEETARRLRSNQVTPSQNGDIERDLAAAKVLENKRTAELNRGAMALTPIGLLRGMAMAMAGNARA